MNTNYEEKEEQNKQKNKTESKDKVKSLAFYIVCFSFLSYYFVFSNTIDEMKYFNVNEENGTVVITRKWFEKIHIISDGFKVHSVIDYDLIPSDKCLNLIEIDLQEDAIPFLCDVIPDSVSTQALFYTDQDKLNKIQKDGLSFYLEFPKKETTRITRNYLLTVILTLIITTIWEQRKFLFDNLIEIIIKLSNRKH